MAKYDYDIIVIGLGPAGMAVSIMGAEMGLGVCAIEKHAIGGECMNVGCIPSKALLSMAKARFDIGQLPKMGLSGLPLPAALNPFQKIREHIEYINTAKTRKMFEKVHLILGEGQAKFVDSHTVLVRERHYTARRIFICVGTSPSVPPIPGIGDVEILTNENLFDLETVPSSMTIIGGGAIGCEMAQAFSRLGCRCTIVHMDDHLIPVGDNDLGDHIESVFKNEGITVLNGRSITRVTRISDGIALVTGKGEEIVSERLLVAAGRRHVVDALDLEKAGVPHGRCGIVVDKWLRTARSHIYGVGDCNGHALLTHAAMHQGMIALMNSMLPPPFRMDYRKFVVPWTVFTTPAVSHVGKTRRQLEREKARFETVETSYRDYGAAIAENIASGFVRAHVSQGGRILGASIIGEGSGEMIGEWALAIQKKMRITDIMLLQHSFPTMSFLSKRVSEIWMMGKMKSERMKKFCRIIFRHLSF